MKTYLKQSWVQKLKLELQVNGDLWVLFALIVVLGAALVIIMLMMAQIARII